MGGSRSFSGAAGPPRARAGRGAPDAARGAIERLEEQFVRLTERRYAVAVASGTVALETALRACGVGPGDEVVLSPYDWGAAAGATLRLGAIPVFADIDPQTYTVDPAMVAGALGPRTRAVVATHIYGHPADVPGILRAARPRGIPVIEDAAQALGARLNGAPAGALGDVACFSLGPGKVVSGGEGGVLVMDDRRIFEGAVAWSQHPVRQLATVGSAAPWRDLGPNGRLSALAAAAALRELEHLDARLGRRRLNCGFLARGLRALPGVRPPVVAPGAEHAWHRFVGSFAPEGASVVSRDQFLAAMTAEGAAVGGGFVGRPLHLNPVFRQRSYGAPGWPWRFVGSRRRYCPGDCPVAEARCAALDVGIGADWAEAGEADAQRVLDALARSWRGRRRPAAPGARDRLSGADALSRPSW